MLSEETIIAVHFVLSTIVKIQLLDEEELRELLVRASHSLGDEKTIEWIKHVHEENI